MSTLNFKPDIDVSSSDAFNWKYIINSKIGLTRLGSMLPAIITFILTFVNKTGYYYSSGVSAAFTWSLLIFLLTALGFPKKLPFWTILVFVFDILLLLGCIGCGVGYILNGVKILRLHLVTSIFTIVCGALSIFNGLALGANAYLWTRPKVNL